MEQLQIIFELWRMVWRRIALIAAISVLGVTATLLIAYILPDKYQAEARILVERQQIREELARSTVTVDVATRLQQIQARLMAYDNMARMIEEMKLYEDRPDLELYEKVDYFRWATKFKTTTAPQVNRFSNTDISAFNIQVTYTDPRKSADIANAFVTQVLELNLGVRKEQATETLEFFQTRERELARALAEVETRITQFKRENEDTLPDSLDYRRDELSRLEDRKLELDQRILEQEGTRGQLLAELAELEQSGSVELVETPGLAELRRLQAQLIQLQSVFSENHREVRALKARIAALEAAVGPVQNDGETQNDALAAREKSLRDRIALIDTTVQTMRDQIAEAERQQTDILASIEDTPKIEMRLNGLERRHTELQEQYANAVRKRAEAETGERLELNQQSERFEVIENALLPESPVSPNRKKIILMGGVASIGLALGLAFLLDLIRPVLRSPAQMQRALDLRPVVSIPVISTRADRQRALMKSIFWILFLGLAIPGALYMFDQKIMPLELLFEKLADRSGVSDFVRMLQQRF